MLNVECWSVECWLGGDALASSQGAALRRGLYSGPSPLSWNRLRRLLGSATGSTWAALAGVTAACSVPPVPVVPPRRCRYQPPYSRSCTSCAARHLLQLFVFLTIRCTPLYAGSRHLLLGILRLGAHTDGERSEVRDARSCRRESAPAWSECIHQHRGWYHEVRQPWSEICDTIPQSTSRSVTEVAYHFFLPAFSPVWVCAVLLIFSMFLSDFHNLWF